MRNRTCLAILKHLKSIMYTLKLNHKTASSEMFKMALEQGCQTRFLEGWSERRCHHEVTVLYSAFGSASQTQTRWQQLISHSYSLKHKHWVLRSLGFTRVRGPCLPHALRVSPYWRNAWVSWHVCDSRAMISPSHRKCRWCSHFNWREATIWFIRGIVWISLAHTGAGERKTPCEGLLVELSEDFIQDVVWTQKQPVNMRGCFKISVFWWKNDRRAQSLHTILLQVTFPTWICCEITFLWCFSCRKDYGWH